MRRLVAADEAITVAIERQRGAVIELTKSRTVLLELDVTAASRTHEELLGRTTALHLFSDLLPFRRWSTGWLAEQKTAPEPNQLGILEGWSTEDSTDTLRTWCGAAPQRRGEPHGGSLLLGRLTSSEIVDPVTLYATSRLLADSLTSSELVVLPGSKPYGRHNPLSRRHMRLLAETRSGAGVGRSSGAASAGSSQFRRTVRPSRRPPRADAIALSRAARRVCRNAA